MTKQGCFRYRAYFDTVVMHCNFTGDIFAVFSQEYITFAVMCGAIVKVLPLEYYYLCLAISTVFLAVVFGRILPMFIKHAYFSLQM